ncbi:MAG TPA: hypothetical protein VLD58_17530 [Gemmatimonadales bacterium]|nr:hypothetical protein [Gemmatimonadales bacterium]
MAQPRETAETATPAQLRMRSIQLGLMFVALAFLIVPFLRDLPLGQTTRTGLLAWLLVALSLYWLYSGLGYRPLLLLQLALFSAAATLLVTKAGLVLFGVNALSILRRTAKGMILIGAGISLLNLGAMVYALFHHSQHFPVRPPPE